MESQRIYAMIPARMGSTRLKMKNLALIDGKPMISYAIRAAKESGVFHKIVVNSEHRVFEAISKRYGVEYYQRPTDLGSSDAKSDSVIADFMGAHPDADVVAWVNSTSPFQSGREVGDVIRHFIAHRLDSLLTVEEKQVHCLYRDRAINFDQNALFARTQDLAPVKAFVYSVMMWRRNPFLAEYSQKGYALFCGKFGTYPISKLTGMVIKNQDDLMIADVLMKGLSEINDQYVVKYDPLID